MSEQIPVPGEQPTVPPASGSAGEAADERPWLFHGIVSGAIGASVIAGFFLIVDAARGQPFWTPAYLGSALFLGEVLARGASLQPALVVGYTAVHGAVFVSLGCMVSFLMVGFGAGPSGLRIGALLAVGLFACFEIAFLAFGATFAPTLMEDFGGGIVAVANGLAALAIAAYVAGPVRRRIARGA